MRRAALLLALVLLGAALAASQTSRSAGVSWEQRVSWSPDGRWIAVKGMPDYGFGAVVARPDGSAVKALQIPGYRGQWSPDGRRLADSSSTLLVESISEGRVDTVAPYPFFGDSFDWSPDSEQLVYDAEGQLFVVRRDGTGRHALTRGHSPSWSPEGLEVAFRRWTPGGCLTEIAIVGAAGGGERTLASGPEGRAGPVWSPDGSRLAYRSACSEAIYVVNRDGSGERVVGSFARSSTYWKSLAWSPDGRWLAAFDFWPARTRLLEVDGPRQATFDGSGPVNWSPQGDRILLTRSTERGMVVVVGSIDGSEREVGLGAGADWSPDGTRIAVVRQLYLDGIRYADCAEQLLILDLAGHVLAGLTPCRLTGGARDDRIVGTPGPDSIFGRAGSDRISGGLGEDRLSGAEGSDRLYGGSGRDLILAGSGADRIGARDGAADRVVCGPGNDRVWADSLDSVDRSCERVMRRSL